MMRGGPPARYGGGHWKAPAASLAQQDKVDIGRPGVEPDYVYPLVHKNVPVLDEARTGHLTGYDILPPPELV
jgi:hypothetical protein